MLPHAGEVLASVGGFVLLGGYLAFYVAEVFASNSSNPRWRARAHGTVFNWAVRARKVWARSVTAKESDTVVGVQTVRNVLMVSTFLGATVCILIQLQVTWLISSETLEMIADIAALDPRLKILQSRTEYRSEASKEMITTSEQLFDMRDDGFVYSGVNAMG